MDPAFLAATMVLRLKAQSDQRRAISQEAAMNRKNLAAQGKMAQLEGLQQHNAILRDLKIFQGKNAAVAGIMNRDDKSLGAIRKKAKKDALKYAARQSLQTKQNLSKLSQEMQMVSMKASNLRKASRIKSLGTIVSTAYKMDQV